MTPFAIMLRATGLSQREAAGFLGVRNDTINKWVTGKDKVPDRVVKEVSDLRKAQNEMADHLMQAIEDSGVEAVELAYVIDEAEAQARGLPCASAHCRVIEEVWSQLLDTDIAVTLAPAGSTAGLAAAADKAGF